MSSIPNLDEDGFFSKNQLSDSAFESFVATKQWENMNPVEIAQFDLTQKRSIFPLNVMLEAYQAVLGRELTPKDLYTPAGKEALYNQVMKLDAAKFGVAENGAVTKLSVPEESLISRLGKLGKLNSIASVADAPLRVMADYKEASELAKKFLENNKLSPEAAQDYPEAIAKTGLVNNALLGAHPEIAAQQYAEWIGKHNIPQDIYQQLDIKGVSKYLIEDRQKPFQLEM